MLVRHLRLLIESVFLFFLILHFLINFPPFQLGEYDAAENYLKEAIELAKEFPEFVESAVFQANLGLVYLKKGLVKRASEICQFTWRIGQKNKHTEVIDQSNYCLEQVKAFQERNK